MYAGYAYCGECGASNGACDHVEWSDPSTCDDCGVEDTDTFVDGVLFCKHCVGMYLRQFSGGDAR